MHFLDYIVEGDSTKYKIHLRENKLSKGLSYKNIHRRVEKLFNNGLIEEVKIEGGYKHGARNFKLTDRGLIYFISETNIIESILSFAEKYPNNLLFETFIYKYFERRTLRNATYCLLKLLENYLKECSVLTIFFLSDAENYQFTEVKDIEDIINNPAFEQMHYFLEWMVNSFVIKVSMMNEKHIDWRQHQFPLSEKHFPTQGRIASSATIEI